MYPTHHGLEKSADHRSVQEKLALGIVSTKASYGLRDFYTQTRHEEVGRESEMLRSDGGLVKD